MGEELRSLLPPHCLLSDLQDRPYLKHMTHGPTATSCKQLISNIFHLSESIRSKQNPSSTLKQKGSYKFYHAVINHSRRYEQ